jgi:hypothetical protein
VIASCRESKLTPSVRCDPFHAAMQGWLDQRGLSFFGKTSHPAHRFGTMTLSHIRFSDFGIAHRHRPSRSWVDFCSSLRSHYRHPNERFGTCWVTLRVGGRQSCLPDSDQVRYCAIAFSILIAPSFVNDKNARRWSRGSGTRRTNPNCSRK